MLSLSMLCGCYDTHKLPQQDDYLPSANCDIVQLRQLAANGCYEIPSDMVCAGRVTSSDRDGNFYRSMFVEDSTGAIEVKLGTYNIAAQYPVGLTVALHLKGLAIMVENGVLQVGLPPQSYDTRPREFEAQEIIDRYVVRGNSVEDIASFACDIASLDDSMCGRFVSVTDLYYTPMAYDRESGYLRFVGADERIIFVYISPYSNLSAMEISTTALAIQGILSYDTIGDEGDKQFVIRPRFKDDISTINSHF